MNKIITKQFIKSVFLPIALFSVLAFFVDRVSKEIVVLYFFTHAAPIHITSFFSIELIYNYGVSFSLLNHLDRNLIIVISITALLLLLYLFMKMLSFNKFYMKVVTGSIIGAAFGNIYDRISYGGVIDFFYFHYQGYGFPIFNFADVLISSSAIILFIHLFFRRNKR